MRQREKVRTVQKDEYDEHTLCDRCGFDLDSKYRYDVFEVEIEAEQGHRYPEGSFTTKMAVDCCQGCWPAVVEALESIGFTFHAYDGQWFDSKDGWPGEEPLKRGDWNLK